MTAFYNSSSKRGEKNKFTSSFLSLIKAEPHRALSSPALPDFVHVSSTGLGVQCLTITREAP